MMTRRRLRLRNLGWYALACGVCLVLFSMGSRLKADDGFRGELLRAEQVTFERLAELQSLSHAVVLLVESNREEALAADREAARKIRAAGLDLHYWIEVARSPELAKAHPEWMASLQGHGEWRRFFPEAPHPAEGEVIKTYPWVPIFSQEGFRAQLARVRDLIEQRPPSQCVWLNDLQGAPSACGCGNPLCRWTSDYGPVRTNTTYDGDAAAQFLERLEAEFPDREWVPVWTPECEEVHGHQDGLCAGVGCYRGICWKAWSKQLDPIARRNGSIAVLLLETALQQTNAGFPPELGWAGQTIQRFQETPTQQTHAPIASQRLIAVVEGWGDRASRWKETQRRLSAAGVGQCLIVRVPIEQGWEPRLYRLKTSP